MKVWKVTLEHNGVRLGLSRGYNERNSGNSWQCLDEPVLSCLGCTERLAWYFRLFFIAFVIMRHGEQ